MSCPVLLRSLFHIVGAIVDCFIGFNEACFHDCGHICWTYHQHRCQFVSHACADDCCQCFDCFRMEWQLLVRHVEFHGCHRSSRLEEPPYSLSQPQAPYLPYCFHSPNSHRGHGPGPLHVNLENLEILQPNPWSLAIHLCSLTTLLSHHPSHHLSYHLQSSEISNCSN